MKIFRIKKEYKSLIKNNFSSKILLHISPFFEKRNDLYVKRSDDWEWIAIFKKRKKFFIDFYIFEKVISTIEFTQKYKIE